MFVSPPDKSNEKSSSDSEENSQLRRQESGYNSDKGQDSVLHTAQAFMDTYVPYQMSPLELPSPLRPESDSFDEDFPAMTGLLDDDDDDFPPMPSLFDDDDDVTAKPSDQTHVTVSQDPPLDMKFQLESLSIQVITILSISCFL